MAYSDKVKDHFTNPRNVGTVENADGIGRVGNPTCGDVMEVSIKVGDNDVIEDVKFRTFGCGAAIATSSMVTELAKGKSLDEAMKITRKDVADELGGLPSQKIHCSNLAADALHDAIKNFQEKREGKPLEDDPTLPENREQFCTCDQLEDGEKCPHCTGAESEELGCSES